jgi:hypothetical protein
MTRQVIVAGGLVDGVWCPNCAAPVRIRIPLHLGSRHRPPAAHLEVCMSCGHHYILVTPQVDVTEVSKKRQWPRPWPAFQWWLNRRDSIRAGRPSVGCAIPDCCKPGWWDCAWYEQTDGGRIRWLFCGRAHRKSWLVWRVL